MDLGFYSELTDDAVQHVDAGFLDPQTFSGFDSVGKFPGSNDSYLTISGASHPFLSSSETFHTPSLGDEEFEIPSIPLDPESALSHHHHHHAVSHFGDPSPGDGGVVPGNAVVGGDDPSFASTYVNTPSQGLEHLSLGGISQPGGSALLGSSLGMDLGHPIGSQFSSSSPMTIDVGQALLSTNQLTTIDQSELSAQLGLGLVGEAMLQESQSPDNRLSPTAAHTSSPQEDDFGRSVLKKSPVSLSISQGVISLDPSACDPPCPSSSLSSTSSASGAPLFASGRKVGDGDGAPGPGQWEPVKPVSAYALFFRDTQAAIKGQNPSTTFGEVSRIVASMWDSLGEDQKQVYKRMNDGAKRDYLRALGTYRAAQVSQAPIEILDDPKPSPPSHSPPAPSHITTSTFNPSRGGRGQPYNPEENTITNICTSNIISDRPQVTTRSRTGAKPPAAAPAPPAIARIIIKQTPSPSGGVTVTAVAAPPRQPPPLLPMHGTAPPPPRLQQMVHSQAPPPLQAKPNATPTAAGSIATPPPLKIKVVPAKLRVGGVVTTTTTLSGDTLLGDVGEMDQSSAASMVTGGGEMEEEMEVELSVTPGGPGVTPALGSGKCVRAGCANTAVENKDWDMEFCSNECVATHCRDVFVAWCAIRG